MRTGKPAFKADEKALHPLTRAFEGGKRDQGGMISEISVNAQKADRRRADIDAELRERREAIDGLAPDQGDGAAQRRW